MKTLKGLLQKKKKKKHSKVCLWDGNTQIFVLEIVLCCHVAQQQQKVAWPIPSNIFSTK